MNQLVTIPISHYCEKARWALERAKIPYVEEGHLQVFHFKHVKKAGGGDTVPVLVTTDGVFDDSTKILLWVNTKLDEKNKLYPTDQAREIEDLEEKLDEGFGVDGRLWFYTYAFHLLPIIKRYTRHYKVPFYEKVLMVIFFPFIRSKIALFLEVKPTSRKESKVAVDKTLEEIKQRLSDGRKYLMGDKFTAADITFASLCAPILFPEKYGVLLPQVSEFPTDMAEQIKIWRAHPAGQFALRLFQEDRHS